ncbi:MAG: ribosome recycling factor [Erysipelotrichaceae bacterium]|jgi:ribosome recycling factor|nr:ribosome recycling factor [Erysipelotrichaceae bacterium]
MNEITLEAKNSMDKAIETYRGSLATLRTGRANPSLLDSVMVDYYGSPIALNQIAAISVPEARQLVIKPYDRGDIRSILAAISAANLGLNPINDENLIRLVIPPLNEERRREIVKQAKKYTEECKVAIRNVRRDYINLARDDEEMSEDLIKRIEKEIQDVTDASNKIIDEIMTKKEAEIMTV